MSANAKVTKRRAADLPTLDDVAKGQVSLDDYEIAHGEDIPEWTEVDFARARPASEIPELAAFFERMRGARGPQKTPVKERVGMRLDADVVRHFRDGGPGWQSRVNDVLRAHLASQAKSMGKHT
jgi:uncharacterized protein (DUF4415 family)